MDILKQELPKRVCAYCRVSTDSEEQKTSYNSQKTYYTDKIKNHPGWIFAGIYADEGITGTSMKKRDEFNKMIKYIKIDFLNNNNLLVFNGFYEIVSSAFKSDTFAEKFHFIKDDFTGVIFCFPSFMQREKLYL